jgi:hypothetical protein
VKKMKMRLGANGVPRELQNFAYLNDYIDNHAPGKYTLNELFASHWPHLRRHRYYVRWFKGAAELGLINIAVGGWRSDGSTEYII